MNRSTIKVLITLAIGLGIVYLLGRIKTNSVIKAKESAIETKLQSCDQAFRMQVDPMTNDTGYTMRDSILVSVSTLVDSAYLTIYTAPSGFTLLMFFMGRGQSIDNEEKIYFLFEDSTRIKCFNNDDLNWNGTASVSSLEPNEFTEKDVVSLTPSQIFKKYKDFPYGDLFKTKRLKSVRIHGINKKYDFDIPPEYRDVLMYSFNCIENFN